MILAGDIPWRRLLDLLAVSANVSPMLFKMAVAFNCCFACLAFARILSSTSLAVGMVVGPVLVPTGDVLWLGRDQSFFDGMEFVDLESSSASLESEDASSANFASSANSDLFERLAKGGLDRSGEWEGFSGVDVTEGERSGSCSSKFWCALGESDFSWGGSPRFGEEETSGEAFSKASGISPSSSTSSSAESASKRLAGWG